MITFPEAVNTSLDIQLYCSFFSKEKTDWVFSQVKRKINSYLSVQRKKRWLFSLRQQIDTNLLIKPHQTQKLAQISDSKTSNNDNVYVPFCSNKNRLPLHSTGSGNAPETTNMVWRNSTNVWTDQYGVYHLSSIISDDFDSTLDPMVCLSSYHIKIIRSSSE